MMTTAKHFPGHGDTATDSHLSVAQVTGDRARLDSVELAPFRKAIAAGVDSVMVAHVTVPALEPDPNRVATTSPAIVTDLLKHQLGFQGIVVTDALDMAGLTRLYSANIGRAAVEAFKAGNDLLLIPADLDASYNAVLEAARSGEIPAARLDASVLKLLKAKARLGLNKARLVDVDALPEIVGKPENLAMGQQIADDAVTLVRDNGKLLPLKQSGTVKDGLPYQHVEEVRNGVVALVLSEDVRTESGRALERADQGPRARCQCHLCGSAHRDRHVRRDIERGGPGASGDCGGLCGAHRGQGHEGANGLTNSVSLNDASGTLLQAILDHAAAKTAVLAMGNPYVAQDFPAIQNYLCTFSNAGISEISAVKALFGEIAIRGHLPVSIPNIAQRGAGIERPPQIAEEGPQHAHTYSGSTVIHAWHSLVVSFGALLALPGCNVNVKKDGEGKEKKVDIETPVGGLHVTKDADVRDIGLPVYPGARRKEQRRQRPRQQRPRQYFQQPVRPESRGHRISVRRSAGKARRLLQRPTQEIWRCAGVPHQRAIILAPT